MSPTRAELVDDITDDPSLKFTERAERVTYGLSVYRAILTGAEVPAPPGNSPYRGPWVDMVLASVQLHRPLILERDERTGAVVAMLAEVGR